MNSVSADRSAGGGFSVGSMLARPSDLVLRGSVPLVECMGQTNRTAVGANERQELAGRCSLACLARRWTLHTGWEDWVEFRAVASGRRGGAAAGRADVPKRIGGRYPGGVERGGEGGASQNVGPTLFGGGRALHRVTGSGGKWDTGVVVLHV